MTQIGDTCSHCNEGTLVYRYEYYPYTHEHLECSTCNSTYNIKYKQMWTEDVNGLACDMMDKVEEEFKKRKMKLTSKKSDEMYSKLQDMLEQFSTGDYKSHH